MQNRPLVLMASTLCMAYVWHTVPSQLSLLIESKDTGGGVIIGSTAKLELFEATLDYALESFGHHGENVLSHRDLK